MAGLEDLRAYGANVEEGMSRCINNEEFYMKMVRKAADEASFDELIQALEAKDLDQAFELAHGLKGALSNLALTPLSDPVSEMVELLRNRTDTDYSGYIEKITAKRAELKAILQ